MIICGEQNKGDICITDPVARALWKRLTEINGTIEFATVQLSPPCPNLQIVAQSISVAMKEVDDAKELLSLLGREEKQETEDLTSTDETDHGEVYYTPSEALEVVQGALGIGSEPDSVLPNPPLSKETNNVK